MERGFQRNTVNSDDYIDYIPDKAEEHLGLLIQQGQICSCERFPTLHGNIWQHRIGHYLEGSCSSCYYFLFYFTFMWLFLQYISSYVIFLSMQTQSNTLKTNTKANASVGNTATRVCWLDPSHSRLVTPLTNAREAAT